MNHFGYRVDLEVEASEGDQLPTAWTLPSLSSTTVEIFMTLRASR